MTAIARHINRQSWSACSCLFNHCRRPPQRPRHPECKHPFEEKNEALLTTAKRPYRRVGSLRVTARHHGACRHRRRDVPRQSLGHHHALVDGAAHRERLVHLRIHLYSAERSGVHVRISCDHHPDKRRDADCRRRGCNEGFVRQRPQHVYGGTAHSARTSSGICLEQPAARRGAVQCAAHRSDNGLPRSLRQRFDITHGDGRCQSNHRRDCDLHAVEHRWGQLHLHRSRQQRIHLQ